VTRGEGIAVLLTRGWDRDELASMSDALVDWIATDTPYWYNGIRAWGPATHQPIPAPETPTTEEIARVANRTAPYMRHRRAAAIARQENLAVLVTEGRAIAQRAGMRAATLAALATIKRLGAAR